MRAFASDTSSCAASGSGVTVPSALNGAWPLITASIETGSGCARSRLALPTRTLSGAMANCLAGSFIRSSKSMDAFSTSTLAIRTCHGLPEPVPFEAVSPRQVSPLVVAARCVIGRWLGLAADASAGATRLTRLIEPSGDIQACALRPETTMLARSTVCSGSATAVFESTTLGTLTQSSLSPRARRPSPVSSIFGSLSFTSNSLPSASA